MKKNKSNYQSDIGRLYTKDEVKELINKATHDCEEELSKKREHLNNALKDNIQLQKENTELKERIEELKKKWDYFVT